MSNNSKKKGKPNNNVSGQGTIARAEGVFRNYGYIAVSLWCKGSEVEVETKSGDNWTGIFRSISARNHIVLGAAERNSAEYFQTSVLSPENVISATVLNVPNIAPLTQEFQTDAQIAERIGVKEMPMKELQPWDGGQSNGGENDCELDKLPGRTWTPNEMFEKNEIEHGVIQVQSQRSITKTHNKSSICHVQTSFNPNLTGYTIQLEEEDTDDFRKCKAKAAQVANAIESDPGHKASIALENDVEDGLSRQQTANGAVFSLTQQESNGKYVPPPKRKPYQNNGKIIRNTPPPSSGSSNQNSPPPPPRDARAPPVNYITQHNQVGHHSVGGTQQHHHHHHHQNNPQQQHIPNVLPQVISSQMQMISQHQNLQNSLPPSRAHMPARSNSHTPPHQFQQGNLVRQGGPHGNSGGGGGASIPHGNGPLGKHTQINGDNKSSRPQPRQHPLRQYQQQERTGQMQSVPPVYSDIKQQQESAAPLPPSSPQVQAVQNIPLPRQPPLPPQQQRSDTANHLPPNQEALKELQNFSQDFKLATVQTSTNPNLNGIASHVVQGGGPSPTVSTQTHINGDDSTHVSLAVGVGAATPLHPMTADASTNVSLSGSTSNGSQSNSNSSLNMISASESTQTATSPQIPNKPSPAESPLSDAEKLQNTVANSKLNPNAKEFVLNPAAKPFQPRSPSTPSASRPHTPQTPSHSPFIPATISGGPGAPPMSVMMPMHYIGISQAQYQTPPPQPARLRKLPIRTDVASQMQHAAAVTGQPLLAPAPLHQFLYNPTATATAHGMNQTAYPPAAVAMHTAAIRMYANENGIPPQIQYLPQPNGNGSPAQPPYQATVQQSQAPPQSYQATPPQAPPQIPMFCFPTQPTHIMPNVPTAYLQQGPPPPPHQHVQVLVHQQHPASQGGNPHGPNP